ncbi:M23 family metallopeptidase [Pseudoalteromonas sp. MMG022]|uniref:M23 family metallopeptidase n=1 Tax=Pseudoalteromonas sp. MMG022 TaxID=2909978 RepID=UPI001F3244C0|nr:M23 family metallopeptidase [Pseudoalteromonas sp. MMG022]MCF6435938.1 M23 family metallopeptidase [Pseudoalteromonas sp. MMG022]
MLKLISRIYKTLFRSKQILIRQNGEIYMLTLASWLQPLLIALVVGAIAWSVINAKSVKHQQSTISSLQAQTEADQQRFLNEKQQMQAQLAQQQQTLNELSEKQLMLQSLVDALPSSLHEASDEVDTVDTNISNDDTNAENSISSDASLPESSAEQNEVSVGEQQEEPPEEDFNTQAQLLVVNQQDLLSALSQNIQTRVTKLASGLAEVGIAPQHESSALAQGGPYHQLELEQLPDEYLSTIDNLVVLNNLEQVLNTLPDSMPVAKDNYYISSQFGFRKDPITGKRAYHKGVDLAGWHKTEIVAPASGVVLRAGKNGGYGKFIEIQHEHGLVSRFGHLHTIKVKKGQQISKSEVIALMGSTGRSTSTHLHYEVLQNGKHINPIKLTKVINRVQ